MPDTSPVVKGFYDPDTATVTYVVRDPGSDACAIVDPVLDFEPKAARCATRSAERVLQYLRSEGLRACWILETHVHADHLSGAAFLREALGAPVAIGARVTQVQRHFAPLFDLGADFPVDGSQFDRLFADGERFAIGALDVEVMATPGHTPGCVSYRCGDAVFVGDTLFMPDYGAARADFPGGDARTLYRSIRRLLALPPATRLFTGHDYRPGGREPRWESSVAQQRADNPMVNERIGEDEFVARREARDRELGAPALILPALQVNIRAGRLPDPAPNGIRYLKLPLDRIGRA
jgi:glyoxylase-like metal-dependent hydrolase (beta-lactamase superfamily II)